METSLKKIDVARRQLVTAIQLYFDGGDSVSVFSLAANAWEVIDVLCNRAGVQSLSNQAREQIPKNKSLKFDYINSPYRNFFKHADRDPESVLENFKKPDIDSLIFLAVEDYLRLLKKSPVEFQVYQLWYMSIYLDKIDDEVFNEIFQIIHPVFPDMQKLIHADQLAWGKKVLMQAQTNQGLLSDVQTESA